MCIVIAITENFKLDVLPFYVIIVYLVGLVWGLNVVPFPYHCYVTFDIAFAACCDVIGVSQQGPFVVELVLYIKKP